MDKVRIIEVKQSIFADNDRDADKLREELKIKKYQNIYKNIK